jgi:hypothetical protein
VTHVLTDRGSCFTADAFEKVCNDIGVDRRRTRPYSLQTNGVVERSNCRGATEVLPINVASHTDPETLLRGFNFAYNQRRQRVLGRLPRSAKVAERLQARPRLKSQRFQPNAEPDIMTAVDTVILYAKRPKTR